MRKRKHIEGEQFLFPELFTEEYVIPKPKIKKVKTLSQRKKSGRLPKQSFSELDIEFWNAQDEWEASQFSLNCKAWKTMWVRVQHAVYNILFRRLHCFKSQDDIESFSYEISSNVMNGFVKKVKAGKPWKVQAPIAGYCSPFCMLMYADRFKQEDRELSLEVNEDDEKNYMKIERTDNGFYREVKDENI